MALSVNVLFFIAGAGILQAFFLAGLIYFHPNSDRSVNKFLALYIFWLCLPMFTPLLFQFIAWQALILVEPFLLLSGPFLYLYIRSFKESITFQKAWPHFILFVIYLGVDFMLFQLWLKRFPIEPTVPAEVVRDPWSLLRASIRIAQIITYPLISLQVLRKYQRSIAQLFSETSKIDLAWINWIIKGCLALAFAMMTLHFLIVKNPENFGLFILINTALVTPYIYIVAFKGLMQPMLWQLKAGVTKEAVHQELKIVESIEVESEKVNSRNDKFVLSNEKREEIVAKTLAAMENEKLYLKTELTLQDISDQLRIPAYQISQAINEGLKKTFYDLVNGYRVEEAKRLLTDPKNKNNKILAVAFDSGFNSKTTFNTVFKKFTGHTPSDFKEQHSIVLAEA
jgi:AraC-like DNA-binding protein